MMVHVMVHVARPQVVASISCQQHFAGRPLHPRHHLAEGRPTLRLATCERSQDR